MDINENMTLPMPEKVSMSEAKWYFSQIGFAVLALRLINTLLQYSAVHYLRYFQPEFVAEIAAGQHWWVDWALSMIPLYFIAFPVFLKLLPKRKYSVPRSRPQGGELTAACFSSIAAIYIFNIFSVILLELISLLSGGRLGGNDSLNQMISSSPIWMTVIGACICAPVMEELIFRKLLIDRARPFGELQACLLSGLLFGMFHGNFRQFFYATALGIIFAYVYIRTGNIFITMAMHAGVNFLGSVLTQIIFDQSKLDKLVAAAEDMTLMTPELLLYSLFIAGAFLVGAGLIITGIILFIIYVRNLKFRDRELVTEKPAAAIYGNIGMLTAIGAMAVTFAISLIN